MVSILTGNISYSKSKENIEKKYLRFCKSGQRENSRAYYKSKISECLRMAGKIQVKCSTLHNT